MKQDVKKTMQIHSKAKVDFYKTYLERYVAILCQSQFIHHIRIYDVFLLPILKYFPEDIQQQYQHLTSLLENHSKSSSWWCDERDAETHLNAEELYTSRCENIIESKVMMESFKLLGTLLAVDCFLTNMHACFNNTLIDMYLRGELKDE